MLHPDIIKYLLILSLAFAGCRKSVDEPARDCNQVIAELKDNNHLRYEYNANGKIQSVMVNNLPGKTLVSYDTEGRLIKYGANTYRYEDGGNRIIDGRGNIYMRNNNNQVVYWERPPQNNQVFKGTFEYDSNGFMTRSKTYIYNKADLSTYVNLVETVYTNTVLNGNLTAVAELSLYSIPGLVTNVVASMRQYIYDPNRPNNIPDTDYRPYKYAKPSAGLLLSETDGSIISSYLYQFDAKGRVTKVDRVTGSDIVTIRTFKYKCE